VLAGKLFGIPVAGTHAHSWIMSFENELEAFKAYADAFPDNCILLVDTYNTLNGVKNAIEAGELLREKGKELLGIRIDSGDLAYFSNKTRKMLDEAGLPHAKIVASNDLDEHILTSLKLQEASIDLWGIGTKLVTAYDQPALGAVYKLSAIKDKAGSWIPKIKVSQQSIKINIPGFHNVKRFISNGKAIGDMVYLEGFDDGDNPFYIIDSIDPTKRKKINPKDLQSDILLKNFFKKGEMVYELPKIQEIRKKTMENLSYFDKTHKRLIKDRKSVV